MKSAAPAAVVDTEPVTIRVTFANCSSSEVASSSAALPAADFIRGFLAIGLTDATIIRVRRRRQIFVAIAALAIILCFLPLRVPHTTGPFPHDAYLWQRAWTPEVSQATTRPSPFNSLCILAAELTWRDGQWSTKSINYDTAALRASGKSIGIAIRVTNLPPRDAKTHERGEVDPIGLRGACVAELRRATGAGLAPRELQLDIDCPESRLDEYVDWVRAVKAAVAPVHVVITALPSWLDRPAFARLVREAGPYVLQVHGIDRPRSIADLTPVCDTALAATWIEQAARIGVPFRVALPTYSYSAAFGAEGKFLILWAEGEMPSLPADAEIKILSPNAADLAKLVADLTRRRPAMMTGIIWFRLPVEGDRLNWSPPTLAAVMAGQTPFAKLLVEQHQSPALRDLTLCNTGDADSTNWRVRARWSNANLIASEPLSGVKILASNAGEITLAPSDAPAARLAAGGRLKLGWLRFDRDTEVACELIPSDEPQTVPHR